MSIELIREVLTQEQKDLIRSCLVVCPEDKSKYIYGSNIGSRPSVEPVEVYQTRDQFVDVPYTFGIGLLGKNSNAGKVYPSIPINFKLKLFDYQVPICDQIRDHLNKNGASTLWGSTGIGKTIIGAKIASDCGLLTCVIIKDVILIEQWVETFKTSTDSDIWIVGESVPLNASIIICMRDRWHQMPLAYRQMIGLLIIDEADTLCTVNGIKCILNFYPRYILSMTATLERNNKMEVILYAFCGKHNVFYEQVKNYTVYKVKTGITHKTVPNSYGPGINWSSFELELQNSDQRNQIVLWVLDRHPGEKIIVLTPRADHVDMLVKLVSQVEKSVGRLKGKDKPEEETRVLIGTNAKIGRGFDEKSAYKNFSGVRSRVLIIMVAPKTHPPLIQEVGRLRVMDPIVYVLVDENKQMKDHWNECRKWFDTKKATITEVKYSG